VQRAINQWYPRGLEMFGNELGGETNVLFGFKDKTNGVAQSEYIAEVQMVIDNTNLAIAQVYHQGAPIPELRKLIGDIMMSGEPRGGLAPENFVFLPSNKFFRKRGPEGIAFQPYNVHGELLTMAFQPISPAQYIDYLKTVLPAKFIASREFAKYVQQMNDFHEWAASQSGFALN